MMKKRLLTVLMALAMIMSVMACGDKGSGAGTSATGSAAEDGSGMESSGGIGSNESTSAAGSAAEDGSDKESAGGSDSAGGQDTEAGSSGDDGSKEMDGKNQVGNNDAAPIDWASVDWERVIARKLQREYQVADLLWIVSDMHKSIIEGEETTLEEVVKNRLGVTLDALDEECRTIIDQLMPLTREEMKSVFRIRWWPSELDNYDWASVDWDRDIGNIYANTDEVSKASELIEIGFDAAMVRKDHEIDEYSSEEYMLDHQSMLVRQSGFRITYDDLDEESKTILTKLDELPWQLIYVLKLYGCELW